MHEFLLIRHGQAAAGPSRMDRDHFLTELGRQQAEALALTLEARQVRPQRIYVSQLTRARQTAEIVQRRTGGELICREDLIEHGTRVLLLDCSVEVAASQHPKLINPQGDVLATGPGADSSGLTPDFCIGGETITALHQRASSAWNSIVHAHVDQEGQTLIIAHGSFLSAMVGEALQLRRQSVWQVEFACTAFIRLRAYRHATSGQIELALCAQEP